MAFPPKTQLEPIDQSKDDADSSQTRKSGPKGPPPASPKPRTASSDSSLYSTAGKAAMMDGQSGLGSEGSNPSVMGIQGLALVQRGIQMLNLAFPENPGLMAVLADITSRLQTMIPQMVAQASNQGMGMQGMQPGMGMMGPAMQAMQPAVGAAGPGMPPPPQAGPMPPGPQGPPMPPMMR